MSELHKADGRSWRNAPCGGRPWGIPSPSMQLRGEADDQRREQIETTDRGPAPRLTQVAFSVVDLAATERWFREGLGFWPAGGARRMMRGPLASAVQGLPRAASTCWWMVDRNEFFQLEMFQFERPLARLMAPDFRPCDIGYTRIGVWVADFDQALTRLGRLGSPPLSDPVGPAGTRRACVRNPDGVYVEIMEDDPLSGAGLASEQIGMPRRRALGHAVGPRPRPVRSLLLPRTRPGSLRCRAASPEARGAVGTGRRADARQRVQRRRRPRRARAVPRSGRAAAPGRLPDLRSRHPQHRVRRSEQARAREALPSRTRGRRAGEPQAASHAWRGRRLRERPGPVLGRAAVDVPASEQALGVHAAAGRQAAEGRHARNRADGADRRARPDHLGCDRRSREHGRVDRPRLGPPDRQRRTGSRWSRVRTAAEASRREHHRTGAGVRAADLVPIPA